MQIINVDLIPGKVMPILHASQFDVGRSLGVKLYNGGAVYALSGTETLTAAVRKPDGNIVTEALTNAGGSLVEIITTEQMTACAGCSLCEIKIEDAGDVIGTANFVLDVEEDPTNGGIASASEIHNLATQVAAIVSEQYDSSNVFFDDEPTEGHGNGYAVTSQGVKRAVDNVQNAVNEVDDKADTNAANIGSLSTLTTTDKSSIVGAVNEVNGKTKPTTVTPTFNSSQSNYSIPFSNTRVYKIGNVVYFSSTIQADTPYGSSPGQEVYSSGMPKPYANENLYMSFCAWNVTSNNMRVIVTSDGKLQCRGGNTGTAYDIAFSYVCQ